MNILFIDSENFKKKIGVVLAKAGRQKLAWDQYDFPGLLAKAFEVEDEPIDRKIFYGAKIKIYEETRDKSLALIEEQRRLKLALEGAGIEFVYAGKVMGNKVFEESTKLTFREKGVDVRMAVDMVEMAHEGTLKTAIIGSSDSDLQPAIAALKRKGVQCVYLGFEDQLNKGLVYTTRRPIVIKSSDVLEFLPPEPKTLI